MIRLYLIRHGETYSNVWKIMQGWSDTPLTKKGVQQGKQLAEKLKLLPFKAIYTSSSERAYDTACLINEHQHLPIQMCKGLKEMNFGSFETQEEHLFEGPVYIMNYDWTKYGGENIDLLTNRIGKTLIQIAEKYEDGNILCITHSIAILAALRYINPSIYDQRMEEKRFIQNCSVTVLLYDHQVFSIECIDQIV